MDVDEWPTGRVILPTFVNKSRKTTKSYPSTGDQFCESRKTAKFHAPVGLLGRLSRTGSNYDSLEETQWSCASYGQLSENRGKRLSPIRLRGISSANREKRQSSTRRSVFSGQLVSASRKTNKYDSLEEAQWPYASFCQLSENRGKRQSPIRLRGISWGSVNVCLHSFQHNSVPTGG